MVPSDNTAKCASPRSIPTSAPVSGREVSVVSTTNEAKIRPAASLMMVTDDGAEGRALDQRTLMSPIFGRRSRPVGVMDQRAFAVNRTACRASFRDFNRGGPTRARSPRSPAKKFRYAASRSRNDCCRTTAETSPSQARPGALFASVVTVLDRSAMDASALRPLGHPHGHEARH